MRNQKYTLGETKIQCALLICITKYSYYILLTRDLTISIKDVRHN